MFAQKRIVLAVVFVFASTLLLSSCSSKPPTKTSEKKPDAGQPSQTQPHQSNESEQVLLPAREAYSKVREAALSWSSDAVLLTLGAPYRMGADRVEGGACLSWSATFYSPSRKQSWVFSYWSGKTFKAGKPLYENVELRFTSIDDFVDSPEIAQKAEAAGIAKIKSIILVAGQTSPYSKLPIEDTVFWEVESSDGTRLYFDAKTGSRLK